MHEPLVSLSNDTRGFFSDPSIAGNIGGGVLRRFTVTFDYGRQAMGLIPNVDDRRRDVYDRSGLVLSDTGQYRVADVRTGTPAARARIPIGGLLLSIDGKAADELPMERLREMLRAPAGTIVRLTLKAHGLSRRFTIALRDYQ